MRTCLCVDVIADRLSPILVYAGASTGCDTDDRSYAQLILNLQQHGAAGVVVGAPEDSDVFQLGCRQATTHAILCTPRSATLYCNAVQHV